MAISSSSVYQTEVCMRDWVYFILSGRMTNRTVFVSKDGILRSGLTGQTGDSLYYHIHFPSFLVFYAGLKYKKVGPEVQNR